MATLRWLATAVVALGACGTDDGGSATDATAASTPTTITTMPTTTMPTTTMPTTTMPTTTRIASPTSTSSTTTTDPVAAGDPEGCVGAPNFDPAGALRQQFVDYLTGCGFTPAEGGCLFDNLDFDDPRVTAGEPQAMLPAFAACGIDEARIVEIGGS